MALTALYTLTDNCKENQSRVLAHGGGTGGALLVDLIERHSSNRDLLSVGLEAIFSLTYDRDEGAQLDHQSALREARVCELLLSLLKSHGSDAEVYATAIKVAACLVAAPESAERLGGAEGCGAIGQVRTFHVDRPVTHLTTSTSLSPEPALSSVSLLQRFIRLCANCLLSGAAMLGDGACPAAGRPCVGGHVLPGRDHAQ